MLNIRITPHCYSPGGSTKWNCVFWSEVHPQISPSRGRSGTPNPHIAQCVTGPHKCTCQKASKSINELSIPPTVGWNYQKSAIPPTAFRLWLGLGSVSGVRCVWLFYYAEFRGRASKARVHRGVGRASPQAGRSSTEGASLHMASVWAFRFN